MKYNFDRIIERRNTDSVKWRVFEEDVLPLWVADMDFSAPKPVIEALTKRVEHGIFGYAIDSQELKETITAMLARRFNWKVTVEDILFTPGVVVGFNLGCQSLAGKGDGVLIQTPVYPPFLRAAANGGFMQQEMELTRSNDGSYSVDFDQFSHSITPQTRAFLLCNPHNPVGRVYAKPELERMAEICLRNRIRIVSDEIHGDLIFKGHQHLPIASLAPEIAQNTITLMAPSKTYNIAGLDFSFAVIQNPDLRRGYEEAKRGVSGGVTFMGMTAALAAYREGQEWLEQVLDYMEGNRDFLLKYLRSEMPEITAGCPEGTYLAWLDCRALGLNEAPCEFFLREARVGLNDGAAFGRGGEGFVRLNFGCPRSVLARALDQMKAALRKR